LITPIYSASTLRIISSKLKSGEESIRLPDSGLNSRTYKVFSLLTPIILPSTSAPELIKCFPLLYLLANIIPLSDKLQDPGISSNFFNNDLPLYAGISKTLLTGSEILCVLDNALYVPIVPIYCYKIFSL